MHRALAFSVLFASISGFVSSGDAAEQTAAEFYKDRQLEFISTGQPGTSYDGWSRLLARHLPKYLPGVSNIVVKGMPGGANITGMNHLYNIAPRDGSTFGITSRLIPLSAVLKNPAVKYDPMKFHWLGGTDSAINICAAMASSKVKKAEDLFEHELLAGGTGAGSGGTVDAVVLSKVLGMKFKVVDGYKGSEEVALAMERGEIDGYCVTLYGLEHQRPGWIAEGKWKVLFTLGKNPIMVNGKEVPSVYKFAKTDEQRAILAFYTARSALARPIMTPPDVPADRVAMLRQAVESALKDPAVAAEAEKMKLNLAPMTAAEVTATVRGIMETPPDIISKSIEVIGAQTLMSGG